MITITSSKFIAIGASLVLLAFSAIIYWPRDSESELAVEEFVESPEPVSIPADPEFEAVVQTGLDMGLSREAAEEVARFSRSAKNLNEDEIEESSISFIEQLADIFESELRTEPEMLPAAVELEALRPLSPKEYAVATYIHKWKEFVSDMNLTDEEAVKQIITDWEETQTNLHRQYREGLISRADYVGRPTIADLQDRLSPYLTPNQLVDIAVNEGLYWESIVLEGNARILEYEQAGYSSGLVGAASDNDLEQARQLLRSGANVNLATTDGRWSPLSRAADGGNVEMARLLVEAGADTNWVSVNQRTALMRAARNGHVEVVRLLASEGADLDYTGPGLGDSSALTSAAMYNQTEVVAELLNWGADASGLFGSLALNYAKDYGNQEMEQMLRDAGASSFAWFLR